MRLLKEAEGNALNNLALALRKSGNLPEAEKHLRAAIEVWENLRTKLDDANKISIFEKQTRTYRLLQEVLIAQNKIEEALEISERGRARAFVDLLARRITHLATHGILDNLRGLGSSIALAPSGQDNGLLTAEEILNLPLNADLVVLSACDTGRGRITGDGVIGLSRSFISAGTPSVVVSLWSVPDESTAFLMTQFYQNLPEKLDKATALREAMITTKQKYPNPRQWAAFTVIGEAE